MTAALTVTAVLLLAVFIGLAVTNHCLQADPEDEETDHV